MVTAVKPKHAIEVKVKCKECDYKDHILISHILKKHKMDPVVYLDKHGGIDKAPLWSSYGYSKIQEHHRSSTTTQMPRPRREVHMSKLFPDFGKAAGMKVRGKVSIFDTPGPLTPTLDPDYMFPEEETQILILVLEKPKRNRPYVQGWSGTGKTELVRNLAALFNANLMDINGDSQQTRHELIGHFDVRDGQMVWVDGVIPRAMRNGHWLLVNELDTMDSHTLNILKPVLEDPATLVILENGGERIVAHPDFRIIATANTWGRGDKTGMFVNTMTQSDADARRWSARIVLNYMPFDEAKMEGPEVDMIKRRFPGDQLEDDEPAKFVHVAYKVRNAFQEGTCDKTFSPAELINWVENFLVFGKSVHYAARISFLNACEPDVRTAIEEMITAVFGDENGNAPASGGP